MKIIKKVDEDTYVEYTMDEYIESGIAVIKISCVVGVISLIAYFLCGYLGI